MVFKFLVLPWVEISGGLSISELAESELIEFILIETLGQKLINFCPWPSSFFSILSGGYSLTRSFGQCLRYLRGPKEALEDP